jgi:hypothetical protein
MSGAHAAPKGGRKLQPVPDLPALNDDLRPPGEDEHAEWARELNEPLPDWLDPEFNDAIDRTVRRMLADAGRVFDSVAADQAAEAQRRANVRRGYAALLDYAGRVPAAAGPDPDTHPYAMTAPDVQQGERHA